MSLPRDLWLYAGAECLARYGTICRRTWPADRHGEDYKETFSRASGKLVIGQDGLLRGVGNNIVGVEYPPGGLLDQFGNPLSTLRLEAGATNKLTAPEDLSNAAWSKNGTTVPSTNNPSPRNGDLTASFLRENTAAGSHEMTQGFTVAAGDTEGLCVFLKANGRTKGQIRIADAAVGTNTFQATFDLTAGTLTAQGGGGTGTLTFATITPLASGWYVIQLYGKQSVADTSVIFWLRLYDNAGAASYTGDGASGMFVWGCVATDNQITGMYWGTGASRSADLLTFPWPYKPQAMWVYTKFIEGGTIIAPNAAWLWQIGRDSAPTTELITYQLNGHYRTLHSNGTATVLSEVSAIPMVGNIVEHLALLNPDGSVTLNQSINGGATIMVGPSAANAFAGDWGLRMLRLNDSDSAGTTGLNGFGSIKAGPGSAVNTIPLARAVGGP